LKSTDCLPDIVKRLYAIVGELKELFSNKRFTPDGHLVGSLGEVLAEYRYGLDSLPNCTECRDARARNGRLVQAKATQGKKIGLGSEPGHLVVLRLMPDRSTEEVFNGPGALTWHNAGPRQKNGQCPIYLSKLRALVLQVSEGSKLTVANE
jgi:uncharacterized protein DUF6998